jgi:uncharacterized protein
LTEPQFTAVEATTGRIIVGRLLPGADLIEGIEAICDQHKIRYAAISFAYGSLSSAGFKILNVPSPGERAVLTPHSVDRRVEFLAGQGLVCDDGQGARATHLHGAISDETGTVKGGHFEKGQNPIYNNMDVTLIELLGVRLTRRWDAETQTVEMEVEQLAKARVD